MMRPAIATLHPQPVQIPQPPSQPPPKPAYKPPAAEMPAEKDKDKDKDKVCVINLLTDPMFLV
jgi:hypothetical protein